MTLNDSPPSYWDDAVAHLSAADQVMARIIDGYPGEVLRARGDAFHTLARAIVGQQISVKAADSVWGKLATFLGDVTPEPILAASDEQLRACGLSGSKVKYLRALAEAFANGYVVPHSWKDKDDETIIGQLVALPGIGRWTAEMCLIFHLVRPDVLPMADIGLIKAIERHYFNAEKTAKSVLVAHAERWKPWRSVATWYLWRSLDPVPVQY